MPLAVFGSPKCIRTTVFWNSDRIVLLVFHEIVQTLSVAIISRDCAYHFQGLWFVLSAYWIFKIFEEKYVPYLLFDQILYSFFNSDCFDSLSLIVTIICKRHALKSITSLFGCSENSNDKCKYLVFLKKNRLK